MPIYDVLPLLHPKFRSNPKLGVELAARNVHCALVKLWPAPATPPVMVMEMDVALASERELPEVVTVSSQTKVPLPVSPPIKPSSGI